MSTVSRLERLSPGQLVPFGGNRLAAVPAELAASFRAGDRLVVVQDSGALLHIPSAEHRLVDDSVSAALGAFQALAGTTDEQVSEFFETFARRLADDDVYAPIAAANKADVVSASERRRSITRLTLTESMREGMIDGLRTWRDSASGRDVVTESLTHQGWSVTARRAPLGVVGFVFEGRPNVVADATGVLRSGNTAVLRIGSDALGSALAIMRHAVEPALRSAGLAPGCVVLAESASRAAGWALFSDRRIALAVARGSGEAVAQLGAVARQAGIPVSLHGTGGAWLVAASSAETQRFRASVFHSLDRKVCNTLNVCCIVADRAPDLVPVFVEALRAAASARRTSARLHVESASVAHVRAELFEETVTVERAHGRSSEPFASTVDLGGLGTEWEWEDSPEVTLVVVDNLDQAMELFNRYSPRLVASLISCDADQHRRFYQGCDAPFVGDGFTRWVDGQFALDRPELGLSNWDNGRLLARSAVLSGDSVFTVRLTATMADPDLHR